MSHEYALAQLLRLGPMRHGEILKCTGWPPRVTRLVLGKLTDTGVVYRLGRGIYAA